MALADNMEIDLLPSSFKFHNFLTQIGEVNISCQIIKMIDSYYIWIGHFSDSQMNDLSLALTSRYENLPISTKLFGSVADSTSTNMAKRFAKKLGNPVYVSFNLQTDTFSMSAIERKLYQEIKNGFDLLDD